MPDDGCRTIASVFNRVHERSHAMTVSKTFVADLIRQNQLAILRARREVRRRKPRVMPRNLIWAMDLTYVRPEANGSAVPVFGIVDHGTRACVLLRMLRERGSIALLRALLDAVEQFGVPARVRTDNEPVFCSRLFRFGLLVLGIRHERTEVMAPWQNGRVERFFGTLKSALRRWREVEAECLVEQRELDRFRFFYNAVRPHSSLGGRVPAEAWDPRWLVTRRSRGEWLWFEGWGGALRGFVFRRE